MAKTPPAKSAIDPDQEECFVLSEGKRIIGQSYRELYNYIYEGVPQIAVGEDIRAKQYLEWIQLPGGMGTSKEAWGRFLLRINGRGDEVSQPKSDFT